MIIQVYVGLQSLLVCIIFQMVIPYNKTITDFHGGKYWVILTPYS